MHTNFHCWTTGTIDRLIDWLIDWLIDCFDFIWFDLFWSDLIWFRFIWSTDCFWAVRILHFGTTHHFSKIPNTYTPIRDYLHVRQAFTKFASRPANSWRTWDSWNLWFFGGRGWLSGVGHGLIYVFRKRSVSFIGHAIQCYLKLFYPLISLTKCRENLKSKQLCLFSWSWFHLFKSWVSLHVKPSCIIFPNEWLLFPRRCDSLLVALAKHTAHFAVSWYFMCYAMLLQCWYETIVLWTNIQLSLLSTIPLASIRSLCLQQALEIEDMFHSAGLSVIEAAVTMKLFHWKRW